MAQKAAVDSALQANKDHQYALKVYTERLEAELKGVDKLIAAIDSDDELDDVLDMGTVSVEGAVKPVSVLLPRLILSEESPFREDAQWKKRYDDFTTVNQMKSREHDALREAVRTENQRMYTFDAQSRGQHPVIDLQAFPSDYFEQNKEGIDWRRIAVKVNSAIPSGVKRTPEECRIRWLGHLHPSFNHGTWTSEETERLRTILEDSEGENVHVNWTEVAKKLETNRTPIDCMRHGMTRRLHVWSPEADQKLLDAIELYGQNNWQIVAMNVSDDATAHQCQKRYFDSLDPTLKNGPWAPDEDKKLLRAISAFTGSSVDSISGVGRDTTLPSGRLAIPWQDVALFVPGRNNNQCRERYQDRLTKTQKSKGKASRAKGKAKNDASSTGSAPRRHQTKPRPAYKEKDKGKQRATSESSDVSGGGTSDDSWEWRSLFQVEDSTADSDSVNRLGKEQERDVQQAQDQEPPKKRGRVGPGPQKRAGKSKTSVASQLQTGENGRTDTSGHADVFVKPAREGRDVGTRRSSRLAKGKS